MSAITRRRFGALIGLGAATALPPLVSSGRARPRVVVVGGGAGGATVARYLVRDSSGALDVTLVERSKRYTSCFFSNLYLGDRRDLGSITHRYDTLAAMEGLSVVHDRAVGVERERKVVTLAGGDELPYDRLVLSPGIELVHDSVPGYSEAAAGIAPHAWRGGAQTALLKAKLDALENGQNIVMVVPPNPYRCPPGPYERVSMMAHVLKMKGFEASTITIIDAKSTFSKQALFAEGWERYYGGMIEWLPPEIHGGVTAVDARAGTVETDFDTFEGALLNIIPAQRAGAIASDAGLADDSGFCPIEAGSMRSRIDPNVFVVGDASVAGAMPKSAFSANSQARVAALVIRGELLGTAVPRADYANTCWSLIAPEDAVKIGARYEAGEDGTIVGTSSFVSDTGEEAELREATYRESLDWYDAIIADMFG